MSLVNAPCGPSTQTGLPGGSARTVLVKSPACRIVNSVQPRCALDAMVNGCSSAARLRCRRNHANWPGANTQLPVAASRSRGCSTRVLTVGLSNRTSRTRNSVVGSSSARHTHR
jgi:hypothetical protein